MLSGNGSNSMTGYLNKSYIEGGRNEAKLKEQLLVSARVDILGHFCAFAFCEKSAFHLDPSWSQSCLV